MAFLECNSMKLRAIEPEDLELIYKWENSSELWIVSNTLAPFSKYVLKHYVENSQLDIYETKQLRLMIDVLSENEKPKTVGCIDLFDFDPYHLRAGIGVLVYNKDDRKKHYATDALSLLVDYCFNYLHLHQLYCNIATDNESSRKLFEHLGFAIVGEKRDWLRTKNGWLGEYLMQVISKQNHI